MADRYDEEGSDIAALQDDVANKLYGTLAGLRGEVMKKEESAAWSKSSPGLEEYDYYLTAGVFEDPTTVNFVTPHETAKGQRLRGRPSIECQCCNERRPTAFPWRTF
jgi:hypothetical protein